MKSARKTAIKIIGVFILIQFVPYGRDHDNPPTVCEPDWNSPRTKATVERSCFDCHSNRTVWPWYSNIAPASWLVQHDVDEARDKLNFTEWGSDRPGEKLDEITDHIREKEMPLGYYLIFHPEARLSDREREELVRSLTATIGEGGEGDETVSHHH